MKSKCCILWRIVKLLSVAAALFCAVYYLNLDQKLLDGAYALSRRVRERGNGDA